MTTLACSTTGRAILAFVVIGSPARDRILVSGSNLLSHAGLSGVTLAALAHQAGMSKSGIFAHFKSKNDLQIQLLDRTAQIAQEHVVAPAFQVEEGLPRLLALVKRWMGWTRHAGLEGGCAVAAGMFELDDQSGPVRDKLLLLEEFWRNLLVDLTKRAVELQHLREGVDVEQFVWEICGIYLSHHISLRFLNDPQADTRAARALDGLIERAHPLTKRRLPSRKQSHA